MHARARNGFVDVQQILALSEAVEEDRHGPEVEPVRPEREGVREQPRDLVEQDAQILRAYRRLDAQQLLDRADIGVLVTHHRRVIEAIHVRQVLQIRSVLREFFGRAMQQADMGIGALDHLSVHLQHEAQHAVGRRMLRPEIQREISDLSHSPPRQCADLFCGSLGIRVVSCA